MTDSPPLSVRREGSLGTECLARTQAFAAADLPANGVSPRVMLTTTEAARRLSVGRSTVYALLACGALESVNIGRLRRIPLDRVEAFVRSCPSALTTRGE